MTNPTNNSAQLIGRSNEKTIRPKVAKVSRREFDLTKKRKASCGLTQTSHPFDVVVGKRSLKPYFILSVDLAFPIAEDSATGWHVAAPTKEKALEGFVRKIEDGIIPVRIFSVDELRHHADVLDRMVSALGAGRKE